MANDQDRNDGAELQRERAAIDALDRELLRLISDRARRAQAIGALKNGPAYRPEREAQVLRRLQAENRGPLSDARSAACSARHVGLPRAGAKTVVRIWVRPALQPRRVTRHFGDSVVAERAARSTRCSAPPRVGAPLAVVPVESSTRAPWVARSISCARRRLRSSGEIKLRIVRIVGQDVTLAP